VLMDLETRTQVLQSPPQMLEQRLLCHCSGMIGEVGVCEGFGCGLLM
jgi:hypothetical protein